jgi:ParB family chromosome partitioning protein
VNDRKMLHVSRVRSHPGNIRGDLGDLSGLVASIRVHGILQPIVVEDQPLPSGQFQIIAGHRRFEAAKKAGLDVVPVVFAHAAGHSEPEELMLVENLQRADLNPIDKARAYGKLRGKGYSVARICARVGVSDATVYTYLALLDLDKASQEKVRSGEVSASDAVAGIRRLRKQRRAREGKPRVGPEWEPDQFTARHPLAKKAQALCEAREHSMRRRVGKTACGQCWETVIRADERTVTSALADAGTLRSAS